MSAPDPTTTIRTASEAGFAAARLMREAASVCPEVALRDPHGFWRGQAEMSLASLLYAASPAGCGGGITWAVRALDNTDPEFTAEPVRGRGEFGQWDFWFLRLLAFDRAIPILLHSGCDIQSRNGAGFDCI